MINNDEPREKPFSWPSSPAEAGRGAGACACVRVPVCVCMPTLVCAGGGRRGPAPRAAGQRTWLCPARERAAAGQAAPGRSAPAAPHPLPGRSPAPRPARRGAAGQHQLVRRGLCSREQKLSCSPGGEGFASSAAPEQKRRCVCWSPAWQAPGPLHGLPLPACKVFVLGGLFTCLCAEKKGKLLEGGRRGLVTVTTALPPLLEGALPSQGHGCPAQRGSSCAAVARGGGSAPPGVRTCLRVGAGAGAEGAPGGWPGGYRERHHHHYPPCAARRDETGEGASTAPRWPLALRNLPQKLGCKSWRRLSAASARLASVPRTLLPGARGTRFASEAAAPLPIFIHLLAVL